MTSFSDRFEQALAYACQLHRDQQRKGSGTPYIAHLLAVAGIVIEFGGTEDEAIAALLHDSVEDQGGAATRDEIGRRFGATIVAIVDGCTDTDQAPKPPWRERKLAHLDHLRTASHSVRFVVAADKLHNLRSLVQDYRQVGAALWSHFRGGRDGTLWYYGETIRILATVKRSPLVEACERQLAELQALVNRAG